MGLPETTPPVSIVLPVRNEVATIGDALRSCLDQDYTGSLEVLVADALSDDGTRDVVRALGKDHAISLIDNEDRNTPAGLNRAIEAASGTVIVRCDAHSILPPTYVTRAVETLERTGAANVGGVQRATGSTPTERAIAAAMTHPLGVGNARFHRGGVEGPADTVYLGVFDAEALRSIGGFDEALLRNQDYELNIRLIEAGHEVWFDPSLEVEYRPRGSLRALWKQYHAYGRWKRRVALLHPTSLKLRQVAPPTLVIGLAIALVLLATTLRPLGILVWLGYVGSLMIVSMGQAARLRDWAGLLVGPAIGTMHVSWGLGFLRGVS